MIPFGMEKGTNLEQERETDIISRRGAGRGKTPFHLPCSLDLSLPLESLSWGEQVDARAEGAWLASWRGQPKPSSASPAPLKVGSLALQQGPGRHCL